MSTVSTADFRNGLILKFDNKLMAITYFQHVKPGKGGAFVRTKLKNVETGQVLERTFRAGEKMDSATLDEQRMQYLYRDGEHFYFMDTETYEQEPLAAEAVSDVLHYLVENMDVTVVRHDGRPIAVQVPNFVELRVTQSDPGLKGDTSGGATKPATLETGYTLQVPLFVNEGDMVRIDTRDGVYMERVKA